MLGITHDGDAHLTNPDWLEIRRKGAAFTATVGDAISAQLAESAAAYRGGGEGA